MCDLWHGLVAGDVCSREGYRVSLRKRDCLRSIYRGLHNETGNIYTHFLGSLLFLYLLYACYGWLQNVHYIHYGMFALYSLSALQCLVSSTVYHTFGCHCTCTFERLLSLDYSGITLCTCSWRSARCWPLGGSLRMVLKLVCFGL
jgi:adiponectin receptor